MILKLVREVFTEVSTIGRMYANGVFICYILEDKDRGLESSTPLAEIQKIKVHITFSNRFQKPLPLVEQYLVLRVLEYILVIQMLIQKDACCLEI